MLANVLAVLLGLGSFTFYMTAFVYPEVHRRSDFLWSGLGLFYAVVLWFCAGQMTGALLLGQLTAVGLLFGLGWQTLSVRREKTPVYQQTPIVITPEVVGDWAKSKLNQLRMVPADAVPVRLEKRSLTAQDQRLEPRRRLAYEYEFVEDGDFTADASGESALELALPVSEEFTEPSEEPSEDLDYPIPPSVAAAVISVEVPETPAVEASNDFPTDTASDTAEARADLAAPDLAASDLLEADSSASDTVKANSDGSELDHAGVERPAPKPVEANPVRAKAESEDEPEDDWADSEDWMDDLAAIAPEETAEKPARKPTDEPIPISREKPSLLATPLILVGWIKDVVAALTRPKPAKPVIDIPRREPSTSAAIRDQRSPQSTPQSPQPTSQINPTQIDSSQPNPPDSNWEESNWDD